MTAKDSSAAGSKPMTPFVHTRPANNEVHKKVWKIKEYLTAFEPIIQNGRAQPCWSEYRRSFVNDIIPFYENIKNLSQNLDTDIYTEVKEFERSLDKMESDYDKCLADNKRLGDKNKHLLAKTRHLQRVMTNLWNDNERFIADNIAKDICSFVLSSEKQVSPRSNCSCKELQSNYDKGHSRVVALEAEVLEKQQMLAKSEHQSSLIQKQFIDLQLKFQNYKERLQNEKVCVPPNATASNAIVEINHLDQQALETEVTQLKDALTSLQIQNDGYKIENANVNRRYLELSTASTHSRTTLTGKMAILNSEIAKLKAEAVGKKNSGPTKLVKPKDPLPKKKQVTFQDPHRSSPRPAQKPQVQQHKKLTVPVNVFQKPKPATVARKPNPKNNFRNHSRLPTKSVKARRAADYYRNLYVDIGQFVVHSTKSVHVKTPQAKHSVNHTKKVWKAARNHNVNTTKTTWRPTGKVVGSVKPQWKPTGRHFALYDNCPLTRIMEPIVEPLELTPSVSSSSKVTMISRFPDYNLSDRKAGSKGISVFLWNAEERDVVPPGFSYECSAWSWTAPNSEVGFINVRIHTVIIDLPNRGSGGESFWEEGDDVGVDVLHFHTCLTDILGFLEKFGWWFEQDIGGENKDDNDMKLVMVNEELNNGSKNKEWQNMV
ncbi:hypothetical protein Tco_1042471 [Tanacetum coccineum]|uniref:Uncharacterized protein n=1 Tax=Tanacetum coccineum TaxID=301880 RepID=A0ABQ5GKK2_9ASTR